MSSGPRAPTPASTAAKPVAVPGRSALRRQCSSGLRRRSRHPPAAAAKGGPSLAVSKQVKAAYEAKLTELEYKERSGEMGNLQDVRKEAARLARQVRDLLLIVPSRNAAKVAAMSDPEDVRALLQQEIELALKGMANG
jgi:hypothetical protein